MALQAQDDKKREEREKFLITTIPITIQAAHEPSLHHVGEEHEQEGKIFRIYFEFTTFNKSCPTMLCGI